MISNQPDNPKWQPGYLWKAFDERSLNIPGLPFLFFFSEKEICKHLIKNVAHYFYQNATNDYKSTRQQPQMATRVSLESARRELSNDTQVAVSIFFSEKQIHNNAGRKSLQTIIKTNITMLLLHSPFLGWSIGNSEWCLLLPWQCCLCGTIFRCT
jgi:hypothetical protein